MNNLTLGLAVLGGIVLAGVVAHSAWSQRRNAPRVAQPESVPPQTPVNPDRTEPGFDAEGFEQPLASKLNNDFESNLIPLGANWVVDKKPALDALIDAMAKISLDEPVSGEAALAALPATRRVGSKSFAIEGLNLNAEWENPRSGERYSAFQAGVQLASRTGALNEIEFSEFVQKVQAFADVFGGEAEFPEMHDEVLRARELDQFASSHDAQLGFTLRAKNVAWSTGYVQQHAARQGFVAGAIAGRMVLPATVQGMPPILSLNFDTQAALSDDPEQSALRSLDLALDVPQVDRSERPYPRLRDVAIALAASMDGTITDTQGRMITRDAMDAIGSELEQLYDTLESRDLAAGSAQARRLFS
ncbi:cell division protein FtsZ [Variovorax sp. PCZ-1]|uniref:cell division protein FtsZ n=1 Tax=Variovorax sp. PCZ-1 TaxID=2835533 RepID=UPI001BCD2375|nr:cell division protein FtsZ [Variovorax sp. PCZ-1]MBS7807290.1 cell division protein FtsZ [Variovorax sp. PCZ-1]